MPILFFGKEPISYLILPIFLLSIATPNNSSDKPPARKEYYMYANTAIRIMEGDITKQNVEAIVNAANEGCLGGGGIDGVIHRAAGEELSSWIEKNIEQQKPGVRCPTGEAQIAPSFNLEKDQGIKWIILTVGPDTRIEKMRKKKEELLTNTYSSSLDKAMEYGITSITFPAISTVIYEYDIKEAAPVAIDAVLKKLDEKKDSSLRLITFIFFLGKHETESFGYNVYSENFKKLLQKKINLRKDDEMVIKIIEKEETKAKELSKTAKERTLKIEEVRKKALEQELAKKIAYEKEIAVIAAQKEAATKREAEERAAAQRAREISAQKIVVKEMKIGKTTKKSGKKSPGRISKKKKRRKKRIAKGKKGTRKHKRKKK